jgi:hypothetical protein
MSRPSASIVINNHDYGRFLGDAVASARRQRLPDVEVIVVDDGSTDDSERVLRAVEPHVRVIRKPWGGQGSAFNAGFEASRGGVVCFLDADDVLAPTALAHALPLFDAPDVARVQWPLRLIDEHGAPRGGVVPTRRRPPADLRRRVIEAGPYLDNRVLAPTSGNAWARGYLERVLPVPEADFPLGADEYLHALCPAHGESRFLDEPEGGYRQHGANRYWRRRFAPEKLDADIARWEAAMAALADALTAQGEAVDRAAWRARSWSYGWLRRLREGRAALETRIPEGERVVLIDGGELGGDLLPRCRVSPLCVRDGEDQGPPADSVEAVRALERRRAEGASHLVVWWAADWWLEHYEGLAAHLRAIAGDPVHRDDAVTVWALPAWDGAAERAASGGRP